MTVEEYNQRLEGVIADLQGGAHGKVMVQVANDALALIRRRVQQEGKDAQNNPYAPYSTKPMLSGSKNMNLSAFNSIAGSKSKRRELKWVTINGNRLFEIEGGYKQFRELHGRQTGYVDFTFSGRMMGNVGLEQESNNVVIVRAKAEEERLKMEGNVARRGKILDCSEQEKKILADIYDQGILNIFRKNGL
jgi:hypothetical protein